MKNTLNTQRAVFIVSLQLYLCPQAFSSFDWMRFSLSLAPTYDSIVEVKLVMPCCHTAPPAPTHTHTPPQLFACPLLSWHVLACSWQSCYESSSPAQTGLLTHLCVGRHSVLVYQWNPVWGRSFAVSMSSAPPPPPSNCCRVITETVITAQQCWWTFLGPWSQSGSGRI